jgi:hypothetical protein
MFKLNSNYEVLSPTGWKDFTGIQKIKKIGQTKIHINDSELICSPLHRVKFNDEFFLAKDIKKAENIFENEYEYYDLIEVENHEYYTNGIISHNCEFLGSSGTLISGWKLKEIVGSHKEPLQKSEEIKLKMYEPPLKTKVPHKYALIADVARGKGGDYSAFSIIDITELPYRQVAVFRDNQIAPADYADVVYKTAKIYNDAIVLTEINDIGEQVGYLLMIEYGYEHVLCTEHAGKMGKRICFGGKKIDRGIRTTKLVKTLGCQMLKLLIEQNKLILLDSESLNELTTFSKKNDSYEAETGKHDDLVMGLVLFAWLTDQPYFREATDINTTASLRERTSEQVSEYLMPFGFDGSVETLKRAYKEYFIENNMNIQYPQFTNENVGKKVAFDGALWEYSEFKQSLW